MRWLARPSSDSNPLWSPDGNWIAFMRSNDGIYIIHPDGSGLKRLTGPTLQASRWIGRRTAIGWRSA